MDFYEQIADEIREVTPGYMDETIINEVASAMASAVEQGFVSCQGFNHFVLSARGIRFTNALLETSAAKVLFDRLMGIGEYS